MNRDERFSEEQLNAFVDNELDPEEKQRVFSETSRCEELDQRICRQRKLKELVKLAYEDIPRPRRKGTSPLERGGLFGRALVATVLLAVGFAMGLLGQRVIESTADPAAVTAQPHKYLLHVASGAPADMAAALQRAESLLASATDDAPRQVEIVANEQGLNMLRSDVTQFAADIAVLQANDVLFYACSKTIQRFQENGIEVRLVPHTITRYTALDRVVIRMQEGWHYEKI
jgi:intracellular sulfur oxidation DsrE/DsrF family protein